MGEPIETVAVPHRRKQFADLKKLKKTEIGKGRVNRVWAISWTTTGLDDSRVTQLTLRGTDAS